MTKKIIILGTAGNCMDILDTINDINTTSQTAKYKCVGFLDDDKNKQGKEFFGIKVLGSLNSASEYNDFYFVNGIGSSRTFRYKHKIISTTNIPDEKFETIVHPTASVSKTVKLGHGNVIFQNATITSNVKTGNHIVVLPCSVISHDDVIGDYTCVAAGVCIGGGVTIGKSCYLGARSSIIENVKIGDNCLIGMGSVVLQDIGDNKVVAGNPAKILK